MALSFGRLRDLAGVAEREVTFGAAMDLEQFREMSLSRLSRLA